MSQFIYLTDVFCPWCYGFAPVMQRIAVQHPGIPIRVLCGDLMPKPTTLAAMQEAYPNLDEFFVRFEKTTGQSAAGFISAMEEDRPLLMDSRAMNISLVALKRLVPGHELEQVEAFQHAVYGLGQDVSLPQVQHSIISRWNVDKERFAALLEDASCREQAEKECRECVGLMGEHRLYPTLLLETGEKQIVLARGFTEYSILQNSLQNALAGVDTIFAQPS